MAMTMTMTMTMIMTMTMTCNMTMLPLGTTKRPSLYFAHRAPLKAIVAAGKKWHPDFEKIFQDGSDPKLFSTFLMEAAKRVRETIKEDVVIKLDTGGNAAPHLSIDTTLVFEFVLNNLN